MTDRKFTAPTTFPAEYVTTDGRKAVIYGRVTNSITPLIGYVTHGTQDAYAVAWSEKGTIYIHEDGAFDLHDIPQKQVHWANDYGDRMGDWHDSREAADGHAGDEPIAVIRREWVPGQPPQYFNFMEEV
jgi:hypothetical protein